MDSTHLQRIQDTLIDLSAAMNVSDSARMVETMTRLDEFAQSGRGTLPVRLQHFLDQRSYAKAIAWCEENLPGSGAVPPKPAG